MDQLILGDCLEELKKLPDKSIDLLLTDPPYGIGAASSKFHNGTSRTKYKFSDWDREPPSGEYFAEMLRVSQYQIIWGGNYFINHLHPTRCMLFWDKHTGANSYADGELAWTNLNAVVKKFDHSWVGANARERGEPRVHPTQKPIDLMRWCISLAPRAETILDPFLGSGATAIAAKMLGRHYIGIEREPEYLEIARKRLSGVETIARPNPQRNKATC